MNTIHNFLKRKRQSERIALNVVLKSEQRSAPYLSLNFVCLAKRYHINYIVQQHNLVACSQHKILLHINSYSSDFSLQNLFCYYINICKNTVLVIGKDNSVDSGNRCIEPNRFVIITCRKRESFPYRRNYGVLRNRYRISGLILCSVYAPCCKAAVFRMKERADRKRVCSALV